MSPNDKLKALKEMVKVVNSRNVNHESWCTYTQMQLSNLFRNDDEYNMIPKLAIIDKSNKAQFAKEATEILNHFINKLEHL